MSTVRRLAALAWLAVAAAGCLATTPGPSPSPPSPVPTEATASRDGITVRLYVGNRQLPTGTTTPASLEIHNNSNVEVRFDEDTCLMLGALTFDGAFGTGPAPTDDPGRSWADPRLARVKATALFNGVSVIGFRPAFAGDDLRTPITCPVSQGAYGLRPGGVIHDDETLVARRTDGLPAWPGIYKAGFTFQTDPPIHVELPIEVTGAPYSGVSRGVAIDAALADERVAAWLATLGTSGIEDGDAWFDQGAWTITVRSTSSGQGTVTVDPSGHIVAVALPPPVP